MDWDDEFDSGYDEVDHLTHSNGVQDDQDSKGGFDPMNITNPVSAYFFLSDDAQDEITREKRKNMKCGSCGHRFSGESYDSCPECFSYDTENIDNDIG